MERSVFHRSVAYTLVGLCCIAVAGCWNPFAPEEGGDPPDTEVQYKLRTTPGNVVYNLNSAYKDMNLEKYLECLAEDFEFILNPEDVDDPGSDLPPSWGKTQEASIHERMFGLGDTTGVDRIDLTLTFRSDFFDEGEDYESPLDDTWLYVEETDLRVTIRDWLFLANADQEFLFQVDPNEFGPDGELLWEIVIWWDREEEKRLGDDHEDGAQEISFGRLKAMYR